jgi:release factor glutamine methyltransferase
MAPLSRPASMASMTSRSNDVASHSELPLRGPVGGSTWSNGNVADLPTHQALADRLARLGFVAAEDEAVEMLERAGSDPDLLERLFDRRVAGEPLSWITGSISFSGLRVEVHHGVYEPRWQSEALSRRAIERLPDKGTAIDLCTGAGAIAMALSAARPNARVLATEIEARAVACARANGVEVYQGDLFSPLPIGVRGQVDVVVGVVPYVPTTALPLLPRDTFTNESTLAYDGGPKGTDVLHRVLVEAPRYLRPGGALLVELGGDQDRDLEGDLDRLGYTDIARYHDEEGDLRAIEASAARTSR